MRFCVLDPPFNKWLAFYRVTKSVELQCVVNLAPFYQEAEKVVGATGFEPATSWSQTKCSTRLSYAPRFRSLCAVENGRQAISRPFA